MFYHVSVNVTSFSSSHTSEVYVLMKYLIVFNLTCHPDPRYLIKNLHHFPVMISPPKEFERTLTLPVGQILIVFSLTESQTNFWI